MHGRAGVNKLLIDWLATPDLDAILQERVALLLQVWPVEYFAKTSFMRRSCSCVAVLTRPLAA